jgi:hypothetical protein
MIQFYMNISQVDYILVFFEVNLNLCLKLKHFMMFSFVFILQLNYVTENVYNTIRLK